MTSSPLRDDYALERLTASQDSPIKVDTTFIQSRTRHKLYDITRAAARTPQRCHKADPRLRNDNGIKHLVPELRPRRSNCN